MLTKHLTQGREVVQTSDAQDHMESPFKHYPPDLQN